MQQSTSTVYLIPSLLDEAATQTIPAYIFDALKNCQVFFVENERSARRFLKSIWKEIVIDDYTWVAISKTDNTVTSQFRNFLQQGKNIGIMSEAGSPGIADPGQELVKAAHALGAKVKPLVGPSSILLAIMASGLNGQQFQFVGYLPIDSLERSKTIRELENESIKKNCTQAFIETPYRNNQLLDTILRSCKPSTQLCIAANITGAKEFIRTQTVENWKKNIPDLHKQPVIFCMLAS